MMQDSRASGGSFRRRDVQFDGAYTGGTAHDTLDHIKSNATIIGIAVVIVLEVSHDGSEPAEGDQPEDDQEQVQTQDRPVVVG